MRAKNTPFYEWHHWIRAQLRDLQPARAVDGDDEALLSAEMVGVGSLSDKDVGALLAGGGDGIEGSMVSDGTVKQPVPISTPKSKRAILRSWLTGGGGGGGLGAGGEGVAGCGVPAKTMPESDVDKSSSDGGRDVVQGSGDASTKDVGRNPHEAVAALQSGGTGGCRGRMLPAAHMRDVIFKLLQQNMSLADKLKKSLQRKRALELALEVEAMDKEEARIHASAVKEVCSLLQAKIDEKEAILKQLDQIAAAGGLNCM